MGAPRYRTRTQRVAPDRCPLAWARVLNRLSPATAELTPWFDGTVAPSRPGWYDRQLYAQDVSGLYVPRRQWWDGRSWRLKPRGQLHWLQRGQYPAWRGLSAPAQAPQR